MELSFLHHLELYVWVWVNISLNDNLEKTAADNAGHCFLFLYRVGYEANVIPRTEHAMWAIQ